MNWRRWTMAGLSAAACAGCVGLTSESGGEGLVYHLPKSILTITVREYHDIEAGRKWYQIAGEAKVATSKDNPALIESNKEIRDETIPDPDHRYVMHYRPSPLSDDRLCLARKPNGLLNDVVFAADDRTSEIVFNVARFVAGAVSPGEKKTGFTQTEADTTTTLKVRSYTTKIDPFNDQDIAIFNAALQRTFKVHLKISFKRMKELIENSASTWPQGCSLKDGGYDDGKAAHCPRKVWEARCGRDTICYRTKLKLPVDLKLDGNTVDINYASIINAWDIGSISVTRAFLVHKITKLRFEDGALLAAVIRKPSEVEQASLLPLHVMNAALSVPSGMWAKAFNSNANEKAELLTATNSLSSKVADLEASQKRLYESLQSGTPGVQVSTEAAGTTYSPDCRDPATGGGGLNWIMQK
jgi:hypothetical protein